MTTYMRNLKQMDEGDGLYPWGVAELTDKWVLLHRDGLPKWAIFYKGKGRTVIVPCQMLKSQMQVPKKRRRLKKRSNN